MARNLPDSYHSAKKKQKLERLAEKYYGKLALLQAWECHTTPDLNYIRDLKKRVRGHKNDIIYRTGEEPC